MNVTIDTHALKQAVKKGLVLILWGGLLSSSLAFSNPDFSEVDDIFGGERHLFRNDDLAYFGVDCPGLCLAEWKIFTTANSAIVGEPFAKWDADADKAVRSPWKVSEQVLSGHMSALAAGRMFNLSNDIFAGIAPRTLSNANPEELDLFLMDPVKGPQTALIERVPLESGWSEVDFAWMADFNYDGFDELVMHTASGDTYLATAKDINDMKAGLKWIKLGRLESKKHSWPHAFAVFETHEKNGRRFRVIAMVEPAAEKKDMFRITYQNIIPTSLQSKIVVTDWLSLARKEDQVTSLSAAVGRYGRTDADQLAVAYVTGGGEARVIAYDIKLDSYNAFIRGGENYLGKEAGISVILKSGRLNGRAEYDQAMAWVGTLGQTVARYSSLRLLTFDGNLNIRESANLGLAAQCFSDFALGRFDRRRPAQPEEQDPNLQVALAWRPRCDTDVAELQVGIVSIDPNQQYKMTLNSQYDEPHVVDSYSGKLVAGDFQGRSLRLGAPTKLTTGQSEVQIALQSPPMHVDWVTPVSGGGPAVLNLSAAPSDYFTKFRAESSKTVSAVNKSSFGTTWSIYDKGNLLVGAGGKDDYLAGTLKYNMKEKLDNLEEWNKGQFDKQTIDVASQTGFGDLVWYTDSRRNVYLYPVVGRRGCLVSKPNCSEAEKAPLLVHFVADDQVSRRVLAGNNLEWFQPVTEPGNVFSYPANYAQLQKLYPDIDPLTAISPVAFATDDIVVEEDFRWDRGSNQDHTVNTGNSFSGDWSIGVKAKTLSSGALVLEGEQDTGFSYDGASKSASTSSTTLSQSNGIGIKKPGLFADPSLYRYDVQPYVLGRKRDNNWPDFGTPNGDIQTAGPLQVAFAVDVAQGGAWWQREAYALPDVALNHPSRWRIADKGDGSLACLGKSCAVFNDAKPSDVWLSPFHWMRGFYVTPAANSDTSSQMSQLTEGEAVRLHARVYNYSLANMPAGSEVKVRFYGQLWNIANNTPSGHSFLLDEKTYSAIPGFGQSPSNEFNWIMAETQFDPSPYANKDLVFWVLVWMEDGFGQKVAEVADHGLSGTSDPGALNTIQEVPIENHSNNVGLYKHAFHVFQSPPPKGKPPRNGGKKLRDKTRVLKFRVTPRNNVVEGETVAVELVLKNLDVPVSQVTDVQFYDYNPGNKGTDNVDSPFDVDQISHIPANKRISVSVPYTPSRCGKTVLYATVPNRNIRVKTRFNVLCR